jgi:hypothetical protein
VNVHFSYCLICKDYCTLIAFESSFCDDDQLISYSIISSLSIWIGLVIYDLNSSHFVGLFEMLRSSIYNLVGSHTIKSIRIRQNWVFDPQIDCIFADASNLTDLTSHWAVFVFDFDNRTPHYDIILAINSDSISITDNFFTYFLNSDIFKAILFIENFKRVWASLNYKTKFFVIFKHNELTSLVSHLIHISHENLSLNICIIFLTKSEIIN